jgi:hypothetical protein
MKTKTKKFDCVAMMHRGGARVLEMTKGMTMAEELAFWKERDAALKKRLAALKRHRAHPSAARSRKAAV